jgi:hypothetical protein
MMHMAHILGHMKAVHDAIYLAQAAVGWNGIGVRCT